MTTNEHKQNESKQNEYKERIEYQNTRAVFEAIDVTYAEFARIVGRQPQAIGAMLNDNPSRAIGPKVARDLEDIFGLPRRWLYKAHSETELLNPPVDGKFYKLRDRKTALGLSVSENGSPAAGYRDLSTRLSARDPAEAIESLSRQLSLVANIDLIDVLMPDELRPESDYGDSFTRSMYRILTETKEKFRLTTLRTKSTTETCWFFTAASLLHEDGVRIYDTRPKDILYTLNVCFGLTPLFRREPRTLVFMEHSDDDRGTWSLLSFEDTGEALSFFTYAEDRGRKTFTLDVEKLEEYVIASTKA